MIDKSKITEMAIVRLGEVGTIYNDNRSEIYKVAEKLLDNIIDTIAVDNNFLFNATTIKLNKSLQEKNILGEYRYNLPIDFLNIIRAKGCRIEGEFIYSKDEEAIITYCRKMSLQEFPDYLTNLLIYNLASVLCDAYSAYSDRKTLMLSYYNREVQRVMNIEGLRFDEVK